MKLPSDPCILRTPDCSFVTEKSTENLCGKKLTTGYQTTSEDFEKVIEHYCSCNVTEQELEVKIEVYLLREFYAPSHVLVQEKTITKIWFEDTIIQLIDRPKIISIVSPVQQGISYDICIPVKKYLREAFGIHELSDLYNNVILESQDLQEISCKILKDIKAWLEVIDRDRKGKANVESAEAIKTTGVCGKTKG